MTWWQDEESPAPAPPPPPPRRRTGPASSDPTLPHHEPTAVWVPPATSGSGGLGGPPTAPGPGAGSGGGAGRPPTPSSPRRQPSRRNPRTLWALVAVIAVAIAGGGAIAWGSNNASSIFPSSSVHPGAPAKQVSQQKADPTAIAGQADPGIVDITAQLTLQNGEAAGTGMVLTPSGEILTNNHVVDEATSLSVKISNSSKTYPAKVIGTDATDDVAIIQAEGASGLTPLTFGNSSSLSVGDSVVAIGNALNKPGPPAVTEGTVTALNRSITVNSDLGGQESLAQLVEHNAQLAPGNSGGPLFNAAGQVIGMNTAAASGAIPQAGTDDGFAIPINNAMTIARQIEAGKNGGNVNVGPRGFLGVEVAQPTSGGGLGGGFGGGGGGRFGNGGSGGGGFDDGGGGDGSQSGTGVLVQGVEPNTPAAAAGITAGDTITAVDGTSVNSQNDLTAVIGAKHPGDVVRVTWVDQSGNQQTAPVRLATNPAAA
jgi:S1-C subfamily serine protease